MGKKRGGSKPKLNIDEFIGTKHNRWTILRLDRIEKDKTYKKYVECQCECGVIKVTGLQHVLNGQSKSCGCLLRDVRKATRISDNHTEITAIVLSYKYHAKARKVEWNLSREEVITIVKQNCYYCNCPPSNIKKTKNTLREGLLYSGIDRKDNGKGYDLENTVACCKNCNMAKRIMTIEEFYTWIQNLHANLKDKKLI